MWTTKRPETFLGRIVLVGITVVKRSACSREDEECLKISLEQHVNVYPLTEVATITHVAWHWIEQGCRLVESPLHSQPGVEVGQIIHAWNRCSDLLFEFVRAKVARLIKE